MQILWHVHVDFTVCHFENNLSAIAAFMILRWGGVGRN